MAAVTVIVNKAGADRLRRGQVWVFRRDLAGPPEAPPGAVVRVVDPAGNFVAYAYLGPAEPALRLLTREDREPGPDLFRERLRQAIARRRAVLGDCDALRLVHAEADLLPGLLVDRLGDGLVMQGLALAVEQRESLFVELLVELERPRVLVLRNDGATRDREALPRRRAVVHGEDPRVTYHEGELALGANLLEDHKTGAYLDQRENHLRAADYASGRALDLFCYHGGFGLQASRRAERVLCIDQDETAVERTRQNAAANGLTNVEARAGNAFDILRAALDASERFQLITLDPPAFAKRQGAMVAGRGRLSAAERAYKDLNLRALRLLEPGGVLITCSCSARVTPELFDRLLHQAAIDAKRRVQVLERRGAGRDHPVLLGVPETGYLKCLVLQVVD